MEVIYKTHHNITVVCNPYLEEKTIMVTPDIFEIVKKRFPQKNEKDQKCINKDCSFSTFSQCTNYEDPNICASRKI